MAQYVGIKSVFLPFFFKEKELQYFILPPFYFLFFILNCSFVEFYIYLDKFLSVFDFMVEKIGFEKVCLKESLSKRIISKFYILFNDTQNIIKKFY